MLPLVFIDDSGTMRLFVTGDADGKATNDFREFNFNRAIAKRKQVCPFDTFFTNDAINDVFFSKKDVIDRIIREEGIEGAQLLSFGDGPVEIEFTKVVGGLAVGVASDEQAHGSGVIDEDKRQHLLHAGADAIIPDYRNTKWILETFFP